MPNIPKVSVIIPVYNVENYLEDCLDSVINQTLKDIEIICVNDGSTDESPDILEKFAAKDDRITIINQENKGAGAARNKGLKIVKGEYLSFLDADDFFELDMLKKAYDYSKENSLDIAVYRVKTFNDKTSEIKMIDYDTREKYLPKKAIFNYKDLPKYVFNTFQNWTWNKLFKRSFILENDIKFQELFRTNDLLFTCKALVKAKKISVLDDRLIYYRIEHDFHSQNTNHEHPFDFYHAMITLKSFLIDEKIFQGDLEQSFVNFATVGCLYNLGSLNTRESYEKLHNFLHEDGINQLSISRRPDNYFYNVGSLQIKKVEKYPLLKPSDTPRVSIIIPVFNVEMYLGECLDSVVNQTLEDIEIICVNDGSTDGSLSILEEYKKKDSRIKIISKPNAGYGHTMNVGIEAATGEYIGIVEPDDYVALDMYGTLYIEAIENDVDFIKADSYRFEGTVKKPKFRRNLTNDHSYYNRIVNPQEDLEPFNFMMNTWSGIYKRDFIEKYNIRHNETPGASFQDNGFYFQTFCRATKTYFLNKAFYFKRLDNPNSSVNDKGKVFAMSTEYDFIRKFLEDNPELKKKFIYIYQLRRFHNYRYNLDRISPTFKKIFLEKFHEDYVLAAEYNELDRELFSKGDWDLLQLIIKDPMMVIESDFKKVPGKSSADKDSVSDLIHKRKFNRLLSFPYILKKENLNPKNVYKIFKARRLIKSLNLFDEKYYLTNYPDVWNSNMNPLDHYIYFGLIEKRSPSKKFNGNYYLRKYSDVKKSKTNPLVHYVLHGKEEGRFPNHQAEIKSTRNINKELMGRIKNLEKSLSQSNNKINKLENYLKFHKYLSELDELNTLKTINPFLNKFQTELKKAENNNELDYSLFNSVELEAFKQIIKDPNTFYIKNYVPEEKYEEYLIEWYFNKTGNKLNLKNPIAFNEKIQWLKLYDSTLFKTELTDKYLVREWIKEKIGEEYLIPLLGVYDNFDEIDFDKLPDKFVIKTNHGSAMNIIVENKEELDRNDVKNKINSWLNKNFAYQVGLELHYSGINPKILIEEFIGKEGRDIEDYKILCFDGKPEIVWVDHDRYRGHKRNVYDLDYNLLPVKITHPVKMKDSNFKDEKPKTWNKMLELSEILSQGFNHVRVDFYSVNDNIYFGEMTFTTGSGLEVFLPEEFHRKMGDLIKLPNMPPKVSVIISVCDVECYLEECLDSVVNQTLEDIEIICVNDGSTDKSLEILEKFAKDNRITIINQESQGDGVAKNNGLKIARGEYISFLNADDFFELDMLEKAYDYSKENSLDIAVFGVTNFNDKTARINKIDYDIQREYLPKKSIFNCEDFSKHVFNTFKNWTWNKIFKRSFILENRIQFQELFNGDPLFTCKALVKAEKISVLDTPLVYHRIKHDFHCQNNNNEDLFDFYHTMIALKSFLIDEKIFDDVEQSFVNLATSRCLHSLKSLNSKESYEKLHNFLYAKGIDELSIGGKPDDYFYDTSFLKIKKVQEYPC